jgi:hypothetical protein
MIWYDMIFGLLQSGAQSHLRVRHTLRTIYGLGQGLSNEPKFVKIGRLEPEIWVDKEIASKWKIYISKLKPVKDIERLIKMVSGAYQNILVLITEASSKILFCEKRTGWSKKVSPVEIFTGHSLNRCSCSGPSLLRLIAILVSFDQYTIKSEQILAHMISSKHQHPVRGCLVKISIGETFLDHPVRFSQNIFFNEASVIKSGMSWHAPNTIFMGFHLISGPQTVVELIITCSKCKVWRP